MPRLTEAALNLHQSIAPVGTLEHDTLEAFRNYFDMVQAQPQLIAAGVMSKQDGTMALRPILVMANSFQEPGTKRFLVWTQIFPKFTTAEGDTSASYFAEGRYFEQDGIDQAVAAFAEKVARAAGSMQSLLRVA